MLPLNDRTGDLATAERREGHFSRGGMVVLAGADLEVSTQLHEVGHVDLVEGGQHRVRVLGALQALRHARAQPRHLHPPAQPAVTRLCTSEHCAT